MKRKDISVLLVVAFVSAFLSVILSGLFFSTPEDRAQKVETAEVIETVFEVPDQKYFNSNSVNPTQNIQIGTDPNSNPFEGR